MHDVNMAVDDAPNVVSDTEGIFGFSGSGNRESISVDDGLDVFGNGFNEEIEEWNKLIHAYENDQFEKGLRDAGMSRLPRITQLLFHSLVCPKRV